MLSSLPPAFPFSLSRVSPPSHPPSHPAAPGTLSDRAGSGMVHYRRWRWALWPRMGRCRSIQILDLFWFWNLIWWWLVGGSDLSILAGRCYLGYCIWGIVVCEGGRRGSWVGLSCVPRTLRALMIFYCNYSRMILLWNFHQMSSILNIILPVQFWI